MNNSKNNDSSRRGFLSSGLLLSFVSLAAAAGVCLCSIGACKKKEAKTPVISRQLIAVKSGRVSVKVDKVAALDHVGGAAKIVHPDLDDRILLIRVNKHGFVAVSNRCTHKGGEVIYNKKEKKLICTNYGQSVFMLSGNVVKGPASRALKTYKLMTIDGNLEIFT